MSEYANVVLKITNELQISAQDVADPFDELCRFLNDLINRDFNAVVQILYRMDVSEAKVREKLANPLPSESAGAILAHLLVERELEKMKWRERFRNGEL